MGFFLQLVPRRAELRPKPRVVHPKPILPPAPAYDPVRARFESECG